MSYLDDFLNGDDEDGLFQQYEEPQQNDQNG